MYQYHCPLVHDSLIGILAMLVIQESEEYFGCEVIIFEDQQVCGELRENACNLEPLRILGACEVGKDPYKLEVHQQEDRGGEHKLTCDSRSEHVPDMKTYHVQQSKATAQVVMFMLHSLTLRGKPSCYTHVVDKQSSGSGLRKPGAASLEAISVSCLQFMDTLQLANTSASR
ncbi:Disks Large-like 2 [Manis pentadactyla]|nr:Disks Large-like 2 [Manis pentadactyla]